MQRIVGALVLYGVMGAGCNLRDQLPTREPGTPCVNEGDRVEDLLCQGGVWTLSPATPDMPVTMMDMSMDQRIAPGDAFGDMPCVGETDAQLCTALGRCALEMSVVDRCDEVRAVVCPDACAMGICIPATGLCEGDCVPKACPDTLECGRVSNGCGAMQICDSCAQGTMCDPDQGMCVCDAPDTATACVGVECGVVTVMNTCGETVDVSCGECQAGYCTNANTCQSPDPITSSRPTAMAMFGESVDIDDELMIVGAPSLQSNGLVGNAFIFARDGNGWSLRYDARDSSELKAPYDGFAMGSSVAISASQELAVIGKSHIDALAPYDGRVALLYLQGNVWTPGLYLTSAGISAGSVTAMSGEHALIGAPMRDSNKGLVNVFTVIENDPSQPIMRDYRGADDGERVGASADIASTQLIFGAPGADGGQGACRIARTDTSNESWRDEQSIPANDPLIDARFCAHVALRQNTFAATFSGRTVNSVSIDTVQIFTSVNDGLNWSFVQEIADPTGAATGGFGAAMAFGQDGTLLIGDALEASQDGSIEKAGVVYRYALDAKGQYVLRDEIRSSMPQRDGRFGAAIATFKNIAIIGAPGQSVEGENGAGAVYEIDLDD